MFKPSAKIIADSVNLQNENILQKFIQYDISFTLFFDLRNTPSFKCIADDCIAFGDSIEECLEDLFEKVMH